jgi:Y_Y_Y domain/Histidine kinase
MQRKMRRASHACCGALTAEPSPGALVHCANVCPAVCTWGNNSRVPEKDGLQSKLTMLDSSDGIAGFNLLPAFSPHIAKSVDGRLWALTSEGPTEIDPHHLPFNRVRPPVHVERIIANHTPYAENAPLHLPALVRDLEMDYTALSLVAPEKVLFRYKLEGFDHDWQNAGTRRQALYTNLPPSNYRFRVIASNNSGVWNEQGATLDFSIAPAYWQTAWFRALCVAAILAFLAMLYWLRMRQLAREFERTLDARVNERTRIARELHDTLLQSFNGLLLRFRTVHRLLATHPDEARQVLESATDEAREALSMTRSAGLRLKRCGTPSATPGRAVSRCSLRMMRAASSLACGITARASIPIS